ncbi:hypothetical protein MKJ04_09110 [Pontibacter sp. E15-1]|uniref:hypothetical protein n=1 Tax=Pontibacter sp. E15-1 TaxID=2919918 RepID=UPI001F4F56B4|nr:hypothetical protein [Pontibacter sp. E15-1]MCJ8165002.1 hypothetical protein [Pontibacter sp. E15-1]
MTKYSIVLLEDDEKIIKSFQFAFEDMGLGNSHELVVFRKSKEYSEYMDEWENRKTVRAIIMDLSNNKQETDAKSYKAAEFIHNEFTTNRIPIFVHSGNLEYFDDLADKGTVYRMEKSDESANNICAQLHLMVESNFLNIFCYGGELETKIMEEIHSAFVEQFKGSEIDDIIKSIKATNPENLVERTREVFQRLALRAVFENLKATKISTAKTFEEVKVHAIEHYYRRTSAYSYWTGDIFESKATSELVVVLTPRCNIGHGNLEEVLLGKINLIEKRHLESFLSKKNDGGENKGRKALRTSITDDVTNGFIGERFRFLTKTPQFKGGFVDYKTIFSMKPENFIKNYTYKISLIDELTNDVVRKLSSYILRGGISETEFDEAHYYFTEETN